MHVVVTESRSGAGGPPGGIEPPERVGERPSRKLAVSGFLAAVLVAALYLPHADKRGGAADVGELSSIIYFVGSTQGPHPPPPQSYELYAFSADRSGFQEIVIPPGPSVTADIDIAPDGKRIAYSNHVRFASRNIYVMAVDGTGRRQVTRPNTYGFPQELHPSWSPDGKWIVFSSTRCCDVVTPKGSSLGNYAIHIVNVDGSGIRRLTDGKAFAWNPAWSPDGSTIAYESAAVRPGNTQIWLIDESGANNRVLTANGQLNFSPAWSPGGDRLAFVSRVPGGDPRAGRWQIRVVDRDGTRETVVLDCGERCHLSGSSIDWSPDGKFLVFNFRNPADLGAPGKIGIIASDGSGFHTLDTRTVDVVEVAWAMGG